MNSTPINPHNSKDSKGYTLNSKTLSSVKSKTTLHATSKVDFSPPVLWEIWDSNILNSITHNNILLIKIIKTHSRSSLANISHGNQKSRCLNSIETTNGLLWPLMDFGMSFRDNKSHKLPKVNKPNWFLFA